MVRRRCRVAARDRLGLAVPRGGDRGQAFGPFDRHTVAGTARRRRAVHRLLVLLLREREPAAASGSLIVGRHVRPGRLLGSSAAYVFVRGCVRRVQFPSPGACAPGAVWRRSRPVLEDSLARCATWQSHAGDALWIVVRRTCWSSGDGSTPVWAGLLSRGAR